MVTAVFYFAIELTRMQILFRFHTK